MLQPCSLHTRVQHWIWGSQDQEKDLTVGSVWAEMQMPPQAVHWISVCTWVPLATAALSTEAKVLEWREENINTWREKRQLKPNPQGFCSSNLASDPSPNRVVTANDQRGSAALHPTLAPPSPASPPTKVIAASTPCGKTMTDIQIKSSPPTKGTRHTQFAQGCPYIRTPLQGHNM